MGQGGRTTTAHLQERLRQAADLIHPRTSELQDPLRRDVEDDRREGMEQAGPSELSRHDFLKRASVS